MSIETRNCTICGEDYPIEIFNNNGRTVSGRQRKRSACKYCEQKRVSKHRKENPHTYIETTCHRCEQVFKVRITPAPKLMAIICHSCSPSENGNKQEASDANSKTSA